MDDLDPMRAHARAVLGALGFLNVLCVDGGQKALEALEEGAARGQNFGLVLCDWNMPEMDGIELLSRVRQIVPLRKIPFVIVTAEVNTRSIVEAITAGASDYMVKPLTEETLGRKLRDLNTRLAKRAA